MNQIKIVSQTSYDQGKAALDQKITNSFDFTGAQNGEIAVYDSTNGNHLKFNKIIKDANGFIILDDSGVELFRVDNNRRVIVGDGTVGSFGITKDGFQKLTSAGWVTLSNNFIDTGWINLTLQNGWVSYGATYANAQCRKIGNEILLRGNIKSGDRADGTVVFTLPDGFIPPYNTSITITGTTPKGRIRISNISGQVSLYNVDQNAQLSFDGIQFYID